MQPRHQGLADNRGRNTVSHYLNDPIEVVENGKVKNTPVSRLWIAHPRRRQYEKVVFDPTDTDPHHYNLWRGFAVEPEPTKSCDRFLAHLRDNICAGNEARPR